jgi:glycerol-3-phosphate dehydrogenase
LKNFPLRVMIGPALSRQDDDAPIRFAALAGRTFDVLIVGGGVIGAGIARDAALRGLRVALFEQADFGGGTTSGSTRLVHGGLRYLEMLDFALVRMDLRERETLLKIAPHLVKPLEFLVPWYGRRLFMRWRLRLGMLLYDLLSFDKSLPNHRWLSRDQVAAAEPHLVSDDLQGAASYYDAQVDLPERLCLENILDAREHGACAFNHTEVVDALRGDSGVNGGGVKGGRVNGLRVRDVMSGETAEVRGAIVVNAAGPWFDGVAARLTSAAESNEPSRSRARRRVRTTKGVHVACPGVIERAVVLNSPIDGRLFFAIPWLGYTWVGTTDTDFNGDPGHARANADDVSYLMESVKRFLPSLDAEHIVFSNAGVRALVMKGGSESSVSRLHAIKDEAANGVAGLISVLGGKITGYRAIAEEATDRVCRALGVSRACETATRPLPGARPSPAEAEAEAIATPPPPAVRAHLTALYGTRAAEVIHLATVDRSLAARLTPSSLDIAAQVIFAVRAEQCLRLSDFLLRRTRLGFSADQGMSAVSRVAELMASELGWSETRRTEELEAYRAAVARTQAFRHENAAAEMDREFALADAPSPSKSFI